MVGRTSVRERVVLSWASAKDARALKSNILWAAILVDVCSSSG